MSYNPPQNPSAFQPQSSFGQSGVSDQHPTSSQPETYKPVLSQDEIRVLKECNTESFYYRCIPLSTLVSGLAYIAMKNGFLQKSPNYGYVPKMLVGVVIGYIGGKISYQSTCAEKIMRLPNSNLGDTLRKRRGGQALFQESLNSEPGFSVTHPSESQKELTIFDERRPDLSEHAEGIDSYDKVTESLSPYTQNDENIQNKSYVTYDDLRKENRDDYMSKLTEKYRKQIPDPLENSRSSFAGSSEPVEPDYGNIRNSPNSRSDSSAKPEIYFNPKKNKYGDIWDD